MFAEKRTTNIYYTSATEATNKGLMVEGKIQIVANRLLSINGEHYFGFYFINNEAETMWVISQTKDSLSNLPTATVYKRISFFNGLKRLIKKDADVVIKLGDLSCSLN